jgi:hypothetical protein
MSPSRGYPSIYYPCYHEELGDIAECRIEAAELELVLGIPFLKFENRTVEMSSDFGRDIIPPFEFGD